MAFPRDSDPGLSLSEPAQTPRCELLRVSGLSVTYGAQRQPLSALRQVNLNVRAGEVVGVLGESGCGKSTLALSLLGLLPSSASAEGSIRFNGQEILGCKESLMQSTRGAKVALIHQDAGLALSPVMRVGDQIAEVIRAHRKTNRSIRRLAVEQILREVQLPDAERIYSSYPHQLSGGELHRIVIAQALVCGPQLVIADEPTRALDVSIQTGILDLLRDLRRKRGIAFLFITHNPALLAGFAERVIVMCGGQVVEEGPLHRVFSKPVHPHTARLLRLVPRSLTEFRSPNNRSSLSTPAPLSLAYDR